MIVIVRRSVETPKFSFILKYTYAPEWGVSINRNIPNLIYSQLLGGSVSFPGNAATKSAFTRALSMYCSVSVSQWRRFHPSFSTSPGLCWQSFPCWTEHWTELESENEPLHVRESVSHCRARPAKLAMENGG